tara:strand:+ start:771 stop:1346 length:576 start_codon:yes stop_codon:yes gene_type:complete
MKFNNFIICFVLMLTLFLTASCKNPFRYTDAREVPVNAKDRVNKNIEEGRGIQFGIGKNSGTGGTFDFASSNELWRASIEVLDFVSFTNASYSGGIIITDWFAGNQKSANNKNLRELKITVRFLSNEIRADGIKVVIHEKICQKKDITNCKIKKIKSNIQNEIKLAILKKATILKKESNNKKFKKKRKKKN